MSAARLFPYLDDLNRKLSGGQLAVPVFVIQGAEDYTAPTSLAKTYKEPLLSRAKLS